MSGKLLVIERILQNCKVVFADNLHCILQLGTSLNNISTANDIDIIVILKNRETLADIQKLKHIAKESPLPLDAQVINLRDLEGWNFSHFTHGQFFVYFLRQAEVLYGTNPFKDMRVDNRYLISSVYQKTQYYYCRAQRQFIKNEYGESPLSEEDYFYHRKKILLMLTDYWLVKSGEVKSIQNLNLKNVLNSLNLESLYLKNLNFLKGIYFKSSFEHIIYLYHVIYIAIRNQLNVKVTDKEWLIG